MSRPPVTKSKEKKAAPAKRITVAVLYRSVLYCGVMCASLAKRRSQISDYVFYMELFAEQMLLGSSKEPLQIQPVQVMRLLLAMAANKFVLVEKRPTHTYYTLLPAGFQFMLQELVLTPTRLPLEDVLYVAHILASYRSQLLAAVAELPAEQHAGVAELLQPGMLLRHQLTLYDQTIAKVQTRQADYARIIRHLDSPAVRDLSLDDRISQLPLGPGIRQTYKTTLREAMAALPPDLKEWELGEGFSRRLDDFYAPYQSGLEAERQLLAGRLAKILENG